MKLGRGALVVYKKRPAIISSLNDKILIETPSGSVRVRDKDIIVLHSGPINSFSELDGNISNNADREVWELYADEPEITRIDIHILAGLFGGDTPKNVWHVWLLLEDGLYFEGTPDMIHVRKKNEVFADEIKRNIKREEDEKRKNFLERLRTDNLNLTEDIHFMQDVLSLALGQSEKSRTLKDAGFPETPESAHELLIKLGVWDAFINPYPTRLGAPLKAPSVRIGIPPDEPRTNLTNLPAFAIDDDGSTDPDDAVSVEKNSEGIFLYVHVADPSASISYDSPQDREARERGATLYSPEGIIRMLHDDSLANYALGLTSTSPAMTFKIKLSSPDGRIEKIDVFRSIVRVERLTYMEACHRPDLADIFDIAETNIKRRTAAAAVHIELPEVNIRVSGHTVSVSIYENYPSRAMVRECMLLAGEAAGMWALEKRIPFPFVGQEVEIPVKNTADNNIPNGYAGAFAMRRCMRPRILSTKPAVHEALGLDIYTQVTSPLRRYTDLLAHEQICAFLRGESVLDEDRLYSRLAVSERAAIIVARTERASRAHWMAVYLSDKIGSEWDGIVMETRGPHVVVLLPKLALEIQTAVKRGTDLNRNDTCVVKLSSVNIPATETRWVMI